ncbi:sugar transferase [Pseudofrankia sp. EUN1h]|uniref:sugar transferase n=1 Tax=Pseudofrankia sp. EUN1h TaxID=1834515 RepID=UPI000234D847|nr:sugar transferase [Pseudofrankia sp. EUN1h]
MDQLAVPRQRTDGEILASDGKRTIRRHHSWLVVLVADVAGLAWPAALLREGRLPLAAFTVVCLLFFHGGRLYRPHLHLSVLDEMPSLISRSLSAALLGGVGVELLGMRPGTKVFAALALTAIATQPLARALAYRFISGVRRKGFGSRTALLIGTESVSAQLAATLTANPGYGLRLIGLLDAASGDRPAERFVPRLGRLDDLPIILRGYGVEVVLVGFSQSSDARVVEMLRATADRPCEIFVVPRLFEIQPARGLRDHIGAIPVARIRYPRRSGPSWLIKRMLDVVLSATALVLLAPVLAVTAIAVWLEDPAGVLFRQIRVGKDGSHFELLKFRSLKPVDDAESATRWNISTDDRLGAVGRFLRRTSLDELPQLWNILRGDMTLVGPRPERPHFVDRFAAEFPVYRHRHRVPSGLTGLAQVSGLRGDTSIEDRARFDNFYIENWSLWLDVKIILMTVREVCFARGR